MLRLVLATVAALAALGVARALGADRPVFAEAVVQGGTAAGTDVDEAAAGYLHLKYNPSLSLSRKVYLQFDFAGVAADTNAPATLRLEFVSSYQQRVQLWTLRQAYPGCSSSLTWNSAQANDTTSNDLLQTGPFTALKIGASAFIPVSGTTPYSFTIPRLGDVLVSNRVTLVLTGVEDAANSQSGLRIKRLTTSLSFAPLVAADYDVYFASGQSNMDGRGATSELVGPLAFWNQPQADIRIYYANPVNLDWENPSYDTGWQLFGPGFSVPPGFTGTLPSTRFGPELAFGRSVADAAPGRTVALIKVSQGGTTLSGDWNPATGYMYRTLTNTARRALQALTNDGAVCTLRGMIWHQGEGDGSSSTAVYQARLADFISSIRRDFQVSNLPFVVGELATNRSLTVRQAQFNVAQTVPFVGFASSSNLVTLAPDDPHFNAAGALLMGQRMASALEVPPVRLLTVGNLGGTLKITGSGLANARCRLVSTTNLALPFPCWTTVASNRFQADGAVTFLHPAAAGSACEFYTIAAD